MLHIVLHKIVFWCTAINIVNIGLWVHLFFYTKRVRAEAKAIQKMVEEGIAHIDRQAEDLIKRAETIGVHLN